MRKHAKPLPGGQYKIAVLRRNHGRLSPASLQCLSWEENYIFAIFCKIAPFFQSCYLHGHVFLMYNYIIQVESDIIAWLRHLNRKSFTKTPNFLETYVEGYLDVPCYREVVLNDEGYQMDLVGVVNLESNWEEKGNQQLPYTALGECWSAAGR